MISNSGRKDQKEMPVRQVSEMIEQQIAATDETRATYLTGLSQVRSARQAGLTRDKERLARKYGAEDSRVREMSARIAVNEKLASTLTSEVDRARTEPVTAKEDEWILHGRVFDAQHRGVPDLTVALYNKRNVWYEKAGFACTDKTGYFRLDLGRDGVPGVKQEPKTETRPYAKQSAAPPNTIEKEVTHVSASAELELYAHVTDRDRKTLAVDDRAITPEAGTVDYIEIVIGGKAGEFSECAPPREPKKAPVKGAKAS